MIVVNLIVAAMLPWTVVPELNHFYDGSYCCLLFLFLVVLIVSLLLLLLL